MLISGRLNVHKVLPHRPEGGPRIVIVGAGAAGIAAACRLIRNGFHNVKILEAEDRIGGRVHTVSKGDINIDLGAHWVHGESENVVYHLAKRHNLVESSGDFNPFNFSYFFSNQKELEPNIGSALYLDSQKPLHDEEALKEYKGSMHDYMMERSFGLIKEMLNGDMNEAEAVWDWIKKMEESYNASDTLNELSPNSFLHYHTCDGDNQLHWKGRGYKTVFDLLLGNIRKTGETQIDLKDHLFLNTEVQEVDYSGSSVVIKCKGGSSFVAEYVIVTVSLGVLKEKWKSMFIPKLPLLKQKAIVSLGIGTVNKIYLTYPHSWWPEGCTGFVLFWLNSDKIVEKDEYAWEKGIYIFSIENSLPNTLTAWLVGEPARDMETYNVEQVSKACQRTLRKFLSSNYPDIPEPIDVTRSTWYSNPHFRGSYSFQSVKSELFDVFPKDLAEPIKNYLGREMLFFAGEATHGSFFSTVHGAVETGWNVAERIIEIEKFDLNSKL